MSARSTDFRKLSCRFAARPPHLCRHTLRSTSVISSEACRRLFFRVYFLVNASACAERTLHHRAVCAPCNPLRSIRRYSRRTETPPCVHPLPELGASVPNPSF